MDPLDRELASLLSVDPSPAFRARVRARIAGEPLPRPWYLQWRAVAAGAAAVAFVAGVAIVGVAPTRAPTPVVALVENGQAASVPALDVAPAPRPRAAAVAANRAPLRANGPEALIDASAGRGIRQLDALVREGRTQLVFDDEPEGKDIVVAPIVVEPITVTTLSEPAGDTEGDRQ